MKTFVKLTKDEEINYLRKQRDTLAALAAELHLNLNKAVPTLPAARELFDTLQTTLQQCRSTHGQFSDNAEIAEYIMEILRQSPNWNTASPTIRVASFQIAHKLGRAFSGILDFEDHWRDIAGYATLIADQCKATTHLDQQPIDWL